MLRKLAQIATELDELGFFALADQTDEIITIVAAKKQESKAVFPIGHAKVKDKKVHFPLSNVAQARNALARANQFSSAPEWFDGTLQELVNSVARAVKKHYPSIDVSKKATKPGKG